MTTIKPFDAGGWFPINNAVFDEIMPRLSPNAFKVLCAVIRKTWGWSVNGDPKQRKKQDQISYSQFAKLTGIKSTHTMSDAITECLESGMITREQHGERMGNPIYEYALNLNFEVESATVENTLTQSISAENAVMTTAENAVMVSAESAVTKQSKQTKINMPLSEETRPNGQAWFLALVEVCRTDLKIATEKQKNYIGKMAKKIKDAGETPQHITNFLTWWKTEDWRGKQGQPPTPSQVCDEWGKFKTSRYYENGASLRVYA